MIQVLVSLVLTQPCICWPFPPLRCHSSVLTRSPVLGCGQVALQWAQLLLEGACERAFTCRNLLFLALKELLRRSTPTRGMWYHATVASDSVQSHLPVADHPVPIALIKGSANDSMPVALPVTNDLVLLSWSSHLDVLGVDLGSFFVSHLCLYWLSAQMLVIVWCTLVVSFRWMLTLSELTLCPRLPFWSALSLLFDDFIPFGNPLCAPISPGYRSWLVPRHVLKTGGGRQVNFSQFYFLFYNLHLF